MASVLITRSEAVDLSGTSPVTVKKAVDQRVVPVRHRGAQALIAADDVPVLAMLGVLSGMRLSLRHKRQVRDWLRAADAPDELELEPAIVVRRVAEVDDARRRAERYTRPRDQWIARDPATKNGEPVIKGSRVGVHTLAARIAAGEPDELLAGDLPHIPAEAREVAVRYAHANPRRGRPASSPWPRRRPSSPSRLGTASSATTTHG